MPKGVKTPRSKEIEVMNSHIETNSYNATSKETGVDDQTVKAIIERNMKEYEQKKEEFINKAEHLIFKSMERMDKELDTQETIPISQLSTSIGILYDKRNIAQNGNIEQNTPNISINIIDNSNLEEALYEDSD